MLYVNNKLRIHEMTNLSLSLQFAKSYVNITQTLYFPERMKQIEKNICVRYKRIITKSKFYFHV